MRLEEPRVRRNADESVVPLINVVFLLLIFFLIAGTMTPPAPLSLDPVTSEASPAARSPAATLFVAADGRMTYGGRAVTADDLAAAVRQDPARRPATPLSVMLDRDLPASALSQVLGALAAGGVTELRLVTIRAGGP